jgi:hypothetical protein
LSALPERTLARFDPSALAPSCATANTNSVNRNESFFDGMRSAS